MTAISLTTVIRGGGDLGTGVAYHLHKQGARVIITELAHPKMVRHTVCLGYAVYNGAQRVEDLTSQLMTIDELHSQTQASGIIPVLIDSETSLIELLKPQFIFDCRMFKYDLPDQRPLAPAVIGLGPGFTAYSRWDDIPKGSAGEMPNVDYVIETQRGEHLGDIITQGRAIPNTGVPGVIGGESSRRLLRAPQAGTFTGTRQVGDLIEAGEIVGYVGGKPVISAIAGLLRGLVHDGLEVSAGEKIGDCDPRGSAVSAFKISDKAHKIGEAAAEIYRKLLPRLHE
ncbi:MAG: selenium-dependent molybdenum cofactor biosynthesis protein YqeB [bacterium]|nr:selenium-dependent molybdenum cofactor biosynthesis protein YqeB [bacterium]